MMHDHGHSHGHEHGHSHSHEIMEHPGLFSEREPMQKRDFAQRAFTVGIGGPVGSGKTALVLQLCRHLRETHNIAVVTNDIFTKEDAEFLIRNQALEKSRIRAVETGGCPHAAIREDISHNLAALEELNEEFKPQILFVESGGGQSGGAVQPRPRRLHDLRDRRFRRRQDSAQGRAGDHAVRSADHKQD